MACLIQYRNQVIALGLVAQSLALVARKLDAWMPFAGLGDAATDEFYHNVHRLAIRYIASQEGTYTIAVCNFSFTIVVDFHGTFYVQTVAEYGLLAHRVGLSYSCFGLCKILAS